MRMRQSSLVGFGISYKVFALSAMLTLALCSAAAGSNDASSPTISSDKADYAPGENVTLTGTNWQPGESVHLDVTSEGGDPPPPPQERANPPRGPGGWPPPPIRTARSRTGSSFPTTSSRSTT